MVSISRKEAWGKLIWPGAGAGDGLRDSLLCASFLWPVLDGSSGLSSDAADLL